jgi:hypothetical protein
VSHILLFLIAVYIPIFFEKQLLWTFWVKTFNFLVDVTKETDYIFSFVMIRHHVGVYFNFKWYSSDTKLFLCTYCFYYTSTVVCSDIII